jgi:hypothetical protein
MALIFQRGISENWGTDNNGAATETTVKTVTSVYILRIF